MKGTNCGQMNLLFVPKLEEEGIGLFVTVSERCF